MPYVKISYKALRAIYSLSTALIWMFSLKKEFTWQKILNKSKPMICNKSSNFLHLQLPFHYILQKKNVVESSIFQ